jgi:hypothetical protein
MKGFSSLTATVTAGHILQGTIKAEFNPVTSETTSKSLKWIGICHSSSFKYPSGPHFELGRLIETVYSYIIAT